MKAPSEQFLRSVMSGERRSITASLMRAGLSVLAVFYCLAVTIRYKLFDCGIRKPKRLPVPVISIGNLTSGGTGKTPVVAWIVELLHKQNRAPAILLRGYTKGSDTTSDEYLLYQDRFERLPNVHVLASPKRYEQAVNALKRPSPPDVFVLDDGFQHRQLYRDLDIVLIDATNPFGYGHLLPRGMLRESKAGLKRSHAIIITRADQISPEKLEDLIASIQRLITNQPVFQCTSALTHLKSVRGDEPIWTLRGRKVFAFCGIGNPGSFQLLLERADANVVALKALDDHQVYSEELVISLVTQALMKGADTLVTTEKDWMKIKYFVMTTDLPVYCARMDIQFPPADASKLLHLINATLTKK